MNEDSSETLQRTWNGWNIQTPTAAASLGDVMSMELAEKLQQEEKTRSQHSSQRPRDYMAGATAGSAASAYTDPHAFADVSKDEEIARELQQQFDQESVGTSVEEEMTSEGLESTDNDLLMAQMLQMEFDKEADDILRREQNKYNKNSKIQVSFEKYRQIHPTQQADIQVSFEKYRQIHPTQQADVYSDEEQEAYEYKLENPNLQFSKKGFRGTGKSIVTKHDPDISGRKNAINAMDKFSFSLDTGDTDKYHTKLPNKVYNKLRVYSMAESKRSARLHEKKDQSTATQAVDRKTRLSLFKMLNSGLLEEVNGVVSIGKESAVLHAVGGELTSGDNKVRRKLPEECALKVFKTTLAEFKNREMYVRGDFRLANEFKKQNPRKIMKMWAEKEMLNLKRMRKFGMTCPEVFKLKKHILLMQFIGKNQVAAPKLKDAKLDTDQLMSAYQQVIQGMKTMYRQCSLVHADLSEYNLLWQEGLVFFIDVSQAVDLAHPLALQFLVRDCNNVINFFTKQQASFKLPTANELFNEVTGMDLFTDASQEEFLQQIQEYEKEQLAHQLDCQRKEFAFDFMFEKHRRDLKEAGIESSDSEDEDLEKSDEEEVNPNKKEGPDENPAEVPSRADNMDKYESLTWTDKNP